MEPKEIPFTDLLKALLDTDTPFNPLFLYRLSDLEQNDLQQFTAAWGLVPTWRRRALMEDIEELSFSDTLLSFVPLALFCAQDEDAQVRVNAVRTLWDYEDKQLIRVYIDLMRSDPDDEVRTAAAIGLGRYVYLGEIEELPEKRLHEIENALLEVVTSSQADGLRCAALEAVGYSSRAEVRPLIEKAYTAKDKAWVASALKAMGRSCNEEWQDKVLAMLEHVMPNVRTEAARAAGELEIKAAKPILIEMLDDPHEDARTASIWALSQIGGADIQKILEKLLDNTKDEEEIDYIETAIDNLIFNQSLLLPIFEIPDDETDPGGDEILFDFYDELDEIYHEDME